MDWVFSPLAALVQQKEFIDVDYGRKLCRCFFSLSLGS